MGHLVPDTAQTDHVQLKGTERQQLHPLAGSGHHRQFTQLYIYVTHGM